MYDLLMFFFKNGDAEIQIKTVKGLGENRVGVEDACIGQFSLLYQNHVKYWGLSF